MDSKDQIAILGFGVEGKSTLKYLMKHKYPNVTVCDIDVDLKTKLPDGVSAQLGEDFYLKDLDRFDVIFRSPGIRFLTPQIQSAMERGTVITSQTAFFLDQTPCPVIGVSGTKGKGTTTTLISEILKKAGKNVHLGGNIGKPPLDFIDKLKGDSLVALEMSSFQLQDLTNSPNYAILLNTTVDHLDYHADRAEYVAAKESLLMHQGKGDVVVFNKDYEYVDEYLPLAKGDVRFVSVERAVEDGAYLDEDKIMYAKGGKSEKVINVSDISLIGSHNLENVMPAVVIAKELGVDNADIKFAVKDFTGLPHRLEFVKEVKGVKYFEDSFSTTPATSMAAVDSFDVPTVLIAGGSDKGSDFGEWAVKILTKRNLHTVVLMGDVAAKNMEDALIEAENKLGDAEGSPTKILRRKDMEEAVLEAYAQAEKGGVVVLSPAAASFDLFKNYKVRGEQFKEAVAKLR